MTSHSDPALQRLLALLTEERSTDDHPAPPELAAFCDGELLEDRERAIRDHLALCPQCSQWVIDRQEFRELAAAPPAAHLEDDEVADAWASLSARLEPEHPSEDPAASPPADPPADPPPHLAAPAVGAVTVDVAGRGGFPRERLWQGIAAAALATLVLVVGLPGRVSDSRPSSFVINVETLLQPVDASILRDPGTPITPLAIDPEAEFTFVQLEDPPRGTDPQPAELLDGAGETLWRGDWSWQSHGDHGTLLPNRHLQAGSYDLIVRARNPEQEVRYRFRVKTAKSP
ncbi:MAG: zf-HC2 domain-containing protein [Acidobacteriota bacterium]